jgi:hypothetical protein
LGINGLIQDLQGIVRGRGSKWVIIKQLIKLSVFEFSMIENQRLME